MSRYAFTTQASEVCEKPRSSRIDGSATFTIVVSSTIIRSPRQRTKSASQRLRLSLAASARSSFSFWPVIASPPPSKCLTNRQTAMARKLIGAGR